MPINSFLYPAPSTPTFPYNVANSARFDDGSSDNLQRTYGTPTNAKIFALSWWIKLGKAFDGSGSQDLWGERTDSNNRVFMGINSTGQFDFFEKNSGSNVVELKTNRLFRDNSAWYHFLLLGDSTQGTASNRIKLYINGVQETSFATATYPSEDYLFRLAVNTVKYFGRIGLGGSLSTNYFDGYLAEAVFVDGNATAHTDYGEFDEDSPTIWKPKDVSGLTFGNNGFHLDFEDSSALGTDVSGNNNDFTANNLTAIDQTTDTCTNNFCTMNPLDNYYASNTYSEGNIKFVTKASGGFAYGTSTIGLSSGKWYAEFDCIATTDSGAYHQVGIVEKPSASTTTSATANIGSSAYSWAYYAADGKSRNSASYSTYGDSWTTGNIIGVYLNLDDNELRFSKDGVIQNSGTAISITAPASNGTGHYFITAGGMSTNASVTFEANFGNPFQSQSSSVSDANGYGAFEYSPTLSGVNYYSINTKNLAEFG